MVKKLPPIGTIVRIPALGDCEEVISEVWAIVVPNDYIREWTGCDEYAVTRILEPSSRNDSGQYWYLVPGEYDWIDVSEDQVPDHIAALAGHCLLDRDFVPFAN